LVVRTVHKCANALSADKAPVLSDERTLWLGLGGAFGFCLTLFIGLVILASADSGTGADAADLSAPTPEQQGEVIYSQRCAGCHGVDGEGVSAPSLGNGAVVERYPDVSDQIQVVTDGRGVMPSFDGTLSPEEIQAVVAFEREVLGR
jgi:mono/diheme cytochrome c family protein